MHKKQIMPFLILATISGLTACSHEARERNQGVTSYAGNAIRSNTVMQMVDPWPEGVEDTDLKTPASRDAGSGEEGASEKPVIAPINTAGD